MKMPTIMPKVYHVCNRYNPFNNRCVITGPSQQKWTTALEVKRVSCKGGSYQDEVCVEQASTGVEVNTKVRHAIILQSVCECGVSR